MSAEPAITVVRVGSGPPRPRPALRSFPSHVRIWLVTAVGLAADLWTKQWAFDSLQPAETRPLISGWLQLRLSLNPGALFGMGRALAPLFVGASVLALMFVLYLFAHSHARQRIMHLALGCVLAGALGNLYDRTLISAYVWRNTQDESQYVGTFIRRDAQSVTIGDFPSGAHPRMLPITPETVDMPRPVVRDFLQITKHAAGIHLWPWIFNIADVLLVVGVGTLLGVFWFEGRRRDRNVDFR
ncbi:MAG: signal peptidase II [Phycisphaerae bacterium]